MAAQLFDRFAQTVDKLPAKAVLRAVRLQRQMLEDDLAHKRTLPMAEAHSIVAFAGFLEKSAATLRAASVTVPIHHLPFYRDTVKRLAEDGILPKESVVLFDVLFAPLWAWAA